jgi:GT2 family glycosyltransferase
VPKLSIIIKAYNEQENIARAIESALRAAEPYDGEVILADGASTDQTVAIGVRYPVTVTELKHPGQRCCGIGAQLGFQHCSGEYVYILDGDMELDAGFIPKAIACMESDADVAGVGGEVQERRANNVEFRGRVNRLNRRVVDEKTDADRLNGGALYRRAALDDVGYMSDRNLHANEEYDLGARLRAKGWHLVRLKDHAADHFAHQLSTRQLLWHRVRSGHLLSSGEVVRAAIDAGYLSRLLREVRLVQLAVAVWIYWLVGALLALFANGAAITGLVLLAGPVLAVAAISLRHRSPAVGCLSFLVWHLAAGGLLFGLLRKRVPPQLPIESRLIACAVERQQRAATSVSSRV